MISISSATTSTPITKLATLDCDPLAANPGFGFRVVGVKGHTLVHTYARESRFVSKKFRPQQQQSRVSGRFQDRHGSREPAISLAEMDAYTLALRPRPPARAGQQHRLGPRLGPGNLPAPGRRGLARPPARMALRPRPRNGHLRRVARHPGPRRSRRTTAPMPPAPPTCASSASTATAPPSCRSNWSPAPPRPPRWPSRHGPRPAAAPTSPCSATTSTRWSESPAKRPSTGATKTNPTTHWSPATSAVPIPPSSAPGSTRCANRCSEIAAAAVEGRGTTRRPPARRPLPGGVPEDPQPRSRRGDRLRFRGRPDRHHHPPVLHRPGPARHPAHHPLRRAATSPPPCSA